MKKDELGSRPYDELWSSLAERGWRSVVLVPAAAGGSTAALAAALADAGERSRGGPVASIATPSIENGYDGALAQLRRQRAHAPPDETARAPEATLGLAPTVELVISVPAVLDEPRALAVARAADAVVVSVHMGRTRLADARRTIELVGRERVVGCFLLT